MPGKEAIARIKFNKLLEDAGWQFYRWMALRPISGLSPA